MKSPADLDPTPADAKARDADPRDARARDAHAGDAGARASVHARVVLRLVGVVALLLLVSTWWLNQPPLADGTPAPAITAQFLDGAPFDPTSFRGKPVLVNVFATWCPACRSELPALATVAQETTGRMAVVGLLIDSRLDDAHALLARAGLPFPVAMADELTKRRWNIDAIPATFLVDVDRHIAWSTTGAVDVDELRSVVAKHVPPAP